MLTTVLSAKNRRDASHIRDANNKRGIPIIAERPGRERMSTTAGS
jgi:hypothetical protein